METPLQIMHVARPAMAASIAAAAGGKLKLSAWQQRLLNFYAGCGDGFAPSLKVIESRTGIPANKIWETRHALEQKRMVEVLGDRLWLNWFRLTAYAAMEPQTKKAAKNALYGSPTRAKTLAQLAEERPRDPDALPVLEARPAPALSFAEKAFYDLISNMTENEYLKFINMHN